MTSVSPVQGCKCVLNGMKLHGRVLKMAPAPAAGEESSERPTDEKEEKRTLCHQVTPLCDLTYEEQIEFKRQMLLGSLEKVTKKLLVDAANGSGVEWVRDLAKGPICPLERMHHSPDLTGYRNKNEFTIGYGEDGKPMVMLTGHAGGHALLPGRVVASDPAMCCGLGLG
jgi:tRNA/tmRNA/rRNA uracil-C5-methylase (TrmA/RlmC/RlmD family)